MTNLHKDLSKNPSLDFEKELKEDLLRKCNEIDVVNQVILEIHLFSTIKIKKLLSGNSIIHESLGCLNQLMEIKLSMNDSYGLSSSSKL